MTDTKSKDAASDDKIVEWFCHLEYEGVAAPPLDRFADALLEGRILGQQCPHCGKVFIGPKDYCPLDAVELDESNDVDCGQKGTVAGYTIVMPVQYYGQQETENFARVSVVLDGPGGSMIQQQLVEVPLDEVRVGLRVEAVWKAEADRAIDEIGGMGGVGIDGCLVGWIPTGEPDVDPEEMKGQAW